MTVKYTDRKGLLNSRLKRLCDRRMKYALSRFQPRIQSIELSVEDLNGPRGGIDKSCRLRIVHEQGLVIVNQKHADLAACISRIADKAARVLARTVSRSLRFKRERFSGPDPNMT